MIVAIDKNLGIGFKNKLLKSIPEDLKRFKRLTAGSVVIMGCEITGNTEDERIDRAGLYQIPQNAPTVEGRT